MTTTASMKNSAITARVFSATPLQLLALIALILFWLPPGKLHGQHSLGVGFHLTPPIALGNAGNPYVVVTPQVGLAGSVTYKKAWAFRKNRKWYAEAGLTTQGLRYHQVNYFGDSVGIWSDFPNQHTGFPSVLFGAGHSFNIGNTKDAFSVGLEASVLLEQTLGEIGSSTFTIYQDPMQHPLSPVFLRLSLAYNRDLHLFKSVSGQLQVYANLSAQKLTKGTRYSHNLHAIEPDVIGNYHVNNSELGVKLFAGLNKSAKKASPASATENVILAQAEKKARFRISVAGQLFAPSRTVYHQPQVDSFSLKSIDVVVTNQVGVVLEFPHRRHELWSTVIGLGIGPRLASINFKSDGRFPTDRTPIAHKKRIKIGHYGIASLGLSRRFATKRLVIAHTLAATLVLPLEKEDAYVGVPLGSDMLQSPPYDNPILEGRVDYTYGRDPVVFGLEYNPELMFKLPNHCFMALGLVANYSRGVIAQGKFTVSNEKRVYYSAMLQSFSKLGITMRIGLER